MRALALPDPNDVASMQGYALCFFCLAVLHTFSVTYFRRLSHRFPEGSIRENLFHFLGEVEVVFGLWAALLIGVWSAKHGTASAILYLENVNFTEPCFVFVIMAICATKPILSFAANMVGLLARLLPLQHGVAFYATTLTVGPLLGSLITEPAAMTVTALLVRDILSNMKASPRFLYATLGLLFVNISVGGTLTNFAAPPVLMVAGAWQWSTPFMFVTFGWRAILVVVVGTVATAAIFRSELREAPQVNVEAARARSPWWLIFSHLVFLGLTIWHSHHLTFFVGLFLFFLGWTSVTKEHQDELRLRESLLVAFFLGGVVMLGKMQDWWLADLVAGMGEMALYWGATALTSVTDNAAITYLGTLVPNLTAAEKYALVAGAVSGGGLTVIANAPNPAGYSILQEKFGEDGISALGLFLGALPYTLLTAAAFLL